MENIESEPLKNPLEELKEAINVSADEIENEFMATRDNSWLDCFDSMLCVIGIYLSIGEVKESLPPERYKAAVSKMEGLKNSIRGLKKQYPNKETIPPEDIRRELLEGLDILKET